MSGNRNTAHPIVFGTHERCHGRFFSVHEIRRSSRLAAPGHNLPRQRPAPMYNALNDSGRDEVGDLPTPLPKPAPRLGRVSTMGREMLASLNRVMAQYPPVAQELGLPLPASGASAPPAVDTSARDAAPDRRGHEGARRRWAVAAATVVQRTGGASSSYPRRRDRVHPAHDDGGDGVAPPHQRPDEGGAAEPARGLREDKGVGRGQQNTIVKVLAVEAVIVGANVWVGTAVGRSPTCGASSRWETASRDGQDDQLVNRFTSRSGAGRARPSAVQGGATAAPPPARLAGGRG